MSLKTLSVAALLVATGCATNAPDSATQTQTSGGETTTAASHPEPVPAPPAESGPACTSSGFMSYEASPRAYAGRHGLAATRFSELETSQEKPLEECSLDAILQRLVTLRCDDGSNPFQGNMNAAHRSRRGSVGPGGRCGAIVDLYEVPCVEGTYEVYADLYFCPAGMSPM